MNNFSFKLLEEDIIVNVNIKSKSKSERYYVLDSIKFHKLNKEYNIYGLLADSNIESLSKTFILRDKKLDI